jgi:hypothetical protein
MLLYFIKTVCYYLNPSTAGVCVGGTRYWGSSMFCKLWSEGLKWPDWATTSEFDRSIISFMPSEYLSVTPTHFTFNSLNPRSRLFLKRRQSLSHYINCLLWNQKVHYRVHKSTLPYPTLSQMSSVHTITLCFINIYFNIIFTSTPRISGMYGY